MKIGFFYRRLEQGGIQKMMVICCNYLVKEGYDVSLILMKPGGDYLSLLDSRIKVIFFSSLKKWKLISSLSHILKKEKFDVVFTATPSLNIFAILTRLISRIKTKIIISERNNTIAFFKKNKWTLSKLTFFAIPVLYRFADGIVTVSKKLGESLKKIALISEKKIFTIYNPANAPENAQQKSLPVDHRWLNSKEMPVIITVGRLVQAKNFSLLIDAISLALQQKPMRLIIIGEGVERQALQSKIDNLNLKENISLEGFKINPISWMSKADVFVLSSDYEGFGNVLVEALSAGATIVSTNCDFGPSEILDNGRYGYLTPINDAKAMAEKILYALDHKFDKAFLEKRATDFSTEIIMKQYKAMFEKVLN